MPTGHTTRDSDLRYDPRLDASWHTPIRLGHSQLTTLITRVGTGCTMVGEEAVTRWRMDRTLDQDGHFIYLRELGHAAYWSATWQPASPQHDFDCTYDCEVTSDVVEIIRRERSLLSRLRITVVPERPIELRVVELTNLANHPRTIELTSYVELVLQLPREFESHPVFSKLFLETRFDPAFAALLARRRTRGPLEKPLHAATWIASESGERRGNIQFETDRARFLGRGRTVAAPRALTTKEPLSGSVGGVLDPIFSLRTTVRIGPAETRRIVFALAAARDEDTLIEAARDLDVTACLLSAPQDAQSGFDSSANSKPQRHAALRARVGVTRAAASYVPWCREHGTAPEPRADEQPLQYFNGWGGFREDGREYVIRLRPDETGELQLPPRPWTHIVSNPSCGVILTERGALSTWAYNSRENRLSPWSNDPVSDPLHERLYLRDREARVYWSPLPGLVQDGCNVTVRYGFGYACYEKQCCELRQETTVFVPCADAMRLVKLTITDQSGRARMLDLTAQHDWAIGTGADTTQPGLSLAWCGEREALLAVRSESNYYAGHCAFTSISRERGDGAAQYSCDRESFFGPLSNGNAPVAVIHDSRLDEALDPVGEPCAALRVPLQIPANGSITVWWILGESETADAANLLLDKYASPQVAERALEEVVEYWRQLLESFQIDTPSTVLNLLVNGWLMYQNVACRLWARSSYYQGGGAFGFRDQLQDSLAMLLTRPDWTRRQILLHAQHQFPEGDVLHWWHPPDSRGLRTRFSDDLLWLPFAALEYTQWTGDHALWATRVPFRAADPLAPEEVERFTETQLSSESATIFDHCCRALDRSTPVGSHGLPLIGCGDWNDGFSRVGAAGRGESVWLAFFLCYVLPRFIPVCRSHGDHDRAKRYEKWWADLRDAIEQYGWDGQWYLRAFLDNGEPLGSHTNDECRIDALVQAWAILSEQANGTRAAQIVRHVEEQLVDRDAGIIRLLTPAFDSPRRDVGYIRGYIAGTRENGGQYTHGILWFIRALAEMGRSDTATDLLEMISPIRHTMTPQQVQCYGAEPYVVAADIYGEPPHTGRAGWTWYTGSAGWMYRVAVESILGIQCREGTRLRVRPRFPSNWTGYRVDYVLPDGTTRYGMHIRRVTPKATQIGRAKLDGRPLIIDEGAVVVPLESDGKRHCVEIVLDSAALISGQDIEAT